MNLPVADALNASLVSQSVPLEVWKLPSPSVAIQFGFGIEDVCVPLDTTSHLMIGTAPPDCVTSQFGSTA